MDMIFFMNDIFINVFILFYFFNKIFFTPCCYNKDVYNICNELMKYITIKYSCYVLESTM